jgi:hypothetical protein
MLKVGSLTETTEVLSILTYMNVPCALSLTLDISSNFTCSSDTRLKTSKTETLASKTWTIMSVLCRVGHDHINVFRDDRVSDHAPTSVLDQLSSELFQFSNQSSLGS